MSLRFRTALFIIFSLFFFIAAPLLVLYTAGYRYNLKAGQVIRSGGLSITSAPRNAMIFLNGSYTDEQTQQVFKRLASGEYIVELAKDNYHPWTGKVDIQEGITTYIQDALLLLDNEPELITTPPGALSVHPKGTHIVYSTQEAGWTDVWLMKLKNQDVKNIGRLAMAPEDIAIDWSADGNHISVLGSNTIAVYTDDGKELVLPEEMPDQIISASWHPSIDHFLYLDDEDSTSEMNIDDRTIETLADDVLLRLNDSELLRTEIQGGNLTLIRDTNDGSNFITILPRGDYQIEALINNFILLSNNHGQLYTIDLRAETPIRFKADATDFDILSRGELILYSDEIELNLYNRSTNTIEFLTRQSDRIHDVAFHPSGARFFIADENSIEAFDTFLLAEDRDTDTIVENVSVEDMWVSASGKTLYFLGNRGEAYGIFSIEITK